MGKSVETRKNAGFLKSYGIQGANTFHGYCSIFSFLSQISEQLDHYFKEFRRENLTAVSPPSGAITYLCIVELEILVDSFLVDFDE